MAIDPKKWTIKTQEAVAAAIDQARALSNPELTPDHLMAALARQDDTLTPAVLAQLGLAPLMVRNKADEAVAKLPKAYGGNEPRMNRELNATFDRADEYRKDLKDDYLSVEHLLLALSSRLGVGSEELLQALKEVRGSHRVTGQNPEEQFAALEKYGQDLTARAREGKIDPVIGRDDEIRRVIQVLSRRTKNNPVLIGEPGVGKTAIVEGLARRIADGDVPEGLRDKRLISLDIGSMVAGAALPNELEGMTTAVDAMHHVLLTTLEPPMTPSDNIRSFRRRRAPVATLIAAGVLGFAGVAAAGPGGFLGDGGVKLPSPTSEASTTTDATTTAPETTVVATTEAADTTMPTTSVVTSTSAEATTTTPADEGQLGEVVLVDDPDTAFNEEDCAEGNHGRTVSSIAQATEPGPDHGPTVREAAQSSCGKHGPDAEGDTDADADADLVEVDEAEEDGDEDRGPRHERDAEDRGARGKGRGHAHHDD